MSGSKRPSSSTARVSVVSAQPAAAGETAATEAPVVAYFPSGYEPCNGTGEGPLRLRMYADNNHKRRRVIVASKTGLDFVGRTSGEEARVPPACKYVLATFNKSTGEIEAAAISGNAICRMEVRAHKADYTADKMFGDLSEAARSVQNKRLVDAFGSTRRRRQLETSEGARVDAERVGAGDAVSEMLAKAAKAAQAAGLTKTQVVAKITGQRNIPPHNLTATTGEAAYSLSSILPDGIKLEYGKLLSASEDADALETLRSKGFVNSYVVGRISAVLAPSEDADDEETATRKKQAKWLSYLSMVMNLYSARRSLRPLESKGGMAAIARSCRVPQDSIEPLLEAFYEQSTEDGEDVFNRSKAKAELLLGHICVSALLTEKCTLGSAQFEELRTALKMTSPDLLARFRELGAKSTVRGGQSGTRVYDIALLKDGKTLKESLPTIKVGRKATK